MHAVAERIAPHGWHIQLQMNGRDLIDRFDALAALPTPLVIDHVGRYMPPVAPDDERFGVLLRLLDTGRCWVKLSAPVRIGTGSFASSTPDVSTLVHALVASTRPNECCGRRTGRIPGRSAPPSLADFDDWQWNGCPTKPCDAASSSTIPPRSTRSTPTPTGAPMTNYASYPSLVDRTVFVTGGADGIGSAMVQQFARKAAAVAFVDKNVEYAHATIQRCVDAGAIHAPQCSTKSTCSTSTRCRQPAPRRSRSSGALPCSSTTRPTTTGTIGAR